MSTYAEEMALRDLDIRASRGDVTALAELRRIMATTNQDRRH